MLNEDLLRKIHARLKKELLTQSDKRFGWTADKDSIQKNIDAVNMRLALVELLAFITGAKLPGVVGFIPRSYAALPEDKHEVYKNLVQEVQAINTKMQKVREDAELHGAKYRDCQRVLSVLEAKSKKKLEDFKVNFGHLLKM